MNALQFILRNLGYFWRTHVLVALGVALTVMVITGSVIVGDSVNHTLARIEALRTAGMVQAFTGGDRFFREELASQSEKAVPMIVYRGSGSTPDRSVLRNGVQVLGVDERFWDEAPEPPPWELNRGEAAINQALAAALGQGAAVGDTLLLRVEEPALLSRDAPLSGANEAITTIRLRIRQIVNDDQWSRFSLQASHLAPPSIFVPLKDLQDEIGQTGRVNVLLTESEKLKLEELDWTLADYEAEIRELPEGAANGQLELRSKRVFLDPPIAEAAMTLEGASASLTYMVNALEPVALDALTPYSVVAALEPKQTGFLPDDLADDEAVITDWLAEDLGLDVGDQVFLRYFVLAGNRELEEQEAAFTVREIVPIDGPAGDRTLMPEFPGVAGEENCRDWEPGMPIDLSLIREKDELYWDEYRGTPKAYITLAKGQELWANRFGKVTGVRFPAGAGAADELAAQLSAQVSPDQVGFQAIAMQGEGAQSPVDFASLLISFSFFLIIACLALTGMLFAFTIQQRATQIGLLRALGWRPGKIQRLLLGEGAVLALAGLVLGLALGTGYAHLILRGFDSIWQDAVGQLPLRLKLSPASMFGAGAGAFLVSILSVGLVTFQAFRLTPRELLTGGEELKPAKKPGWGRWVRRVFIVVLTLGGISFALNASGGQTESFFGAGFMIFMALALAIAEWLSLMRSTESAALHTVPGLATRNTSRRPARSLVTVLSLAAGLFMVLSVTAFVQGISADASEDRASGTGGFQLLGRSTVPIYEDLRTPEGRAELALDDELFEGVTVVPMRVFEAEEASCLNLSKTNRPTLLGVDPSELEERFTFVGAAPGCTTAEGWEILNPKGRGEDKIVPAVGDLNAILWAMKKQLGDTVHYPGPENSEVRLAGAVNNTILQGLLLVSENDFIELFPNAGGYQFFLFDAPPQKVGALEEHLSQQLSRQGMEMTRTSERLAQFNAVQNTYIRIFQALGGLGVLLGTVGLGIILARNAVERRSELALLSAVGYRQGLVRGLLFLEHSVLILIALGVGAVAAGVSLLPSLTGQSAVTPPWALLSGIIVGMAVIALFSCLATAHLAYRPGEALESLRRE